MTKAQAIAAKAIEAANHKAGTIDERNLQTIVGILTLPRKYSGVMKHSQARQIKWDLVDHLLTNFTEQFVDYGYTQEEREYAEAQIRRIAGMLNVTNHIDL